MQEISQRKLAQWIWISLYRCTMHQSCRQGHILLYGTFVGCIQRLRVFLLSTRKYLPNHCIHWHYMVQYTFRDVVVMILQGLNCSKTLTCRIIAECFWLTMNCITLMQVRYLQIAKKSKAYNPYRWVWYVTQANSYASMRNPHLYTCFQSIFLV
jgi:hypothetical protein